MRLLVLSFVLISASAYIMFEANLPIGLGSEEPPEPQLLKCEELLQPRSAVTTSKTGVDIDIYRGELPPETSPAEWVDVFPVVARVRITPTASESCETKDGGSNGAPFVVTVKGAEVLEYIKGDGPRNLQMAFWGGTIGDFTTTVEGLASADDLPAGGEAIVFLSPHQGDWLVENAYVIQGDLAVSRVDGREMPKVDLLSELRSAAEDAATE